MKKQFFQFISLFLIVVTLAGCGGKAKESPAPGTELAVFYQAILDVQPADAEELILPQTGHKLEDVEAAPATCVNAGVMAHQYCIHCNGLFLNDAPVKASELTTTTTSHVMSDWFTDERDHWKNCVDCGVVFLQNVHTDMDFDLFCDE